MSKAPTAPEEPNIHRSETRRQSQVWNRASEPSSGRRDQSCSSSAVWGACLPNAKHTKAGKILPTLQHSLFIGICWETNCLWELEMCALPLGEELTGRRSLAITRLNTGRKWINKISWIKFNSWRTERFLYFCQCVAVSFVKEFHNIFGQLLGFRIFSWFFILSFHKILKFILTRPGNFHAKIWQIL